MFSSSLSQNKRRRQWSSATDRHSPDDEFQGKQRQRAARPARRRRWLVLTVVLLTVLVWSLPMVVAHSPLLNWVVSLATGDLNGRATLQSASLGWFSPVRASGLQIHDEQGNLVVDLPKAAGDTSLWNLALNPRRLGTFTLEKPTIHVVLGPDGSNIEELIANYLTGRSGKPVAVKLEVIDATIHVQDHTTGQSSRIEKFNLSLSTSDREDGPIVLTASGIVPQKARPGEFAVKLEKDEDYRLEFRATGLELAHLNSLLERFSPGTRLAGRLDTTKATTVDCRWGGQSSGADGSLVRLAAHLNVNDFVLACPQLGGDRIRLAALAAEGQLAFAQGKILLERAHVESDVGRVSLAGSLELAGADPGQVLDSLLKQTFEIQANVDLPRAAAMLPGTLHVNRQTQITAGQLKLDWANRGGPQGMVCRGHLEMSNLAAVHRGQPLVWQQPIVVSLDARQTAAGPVVDRLHCRSSFLTLEAAGSRQNLTAFVQFDLDRLARQLDGFVDLGGLQVAGSGSANLDCVCDQQNRFRADADLRIRDFRLAWPGRQPWQEDNLVAALSATGTTDFGAGGRIDSAKLDVKAGTEHLMVHLTEPVTEWKPSGPWPLAVDAQGNLERCAARAKAWNLLEGWDAAGRFRLTAKIVGSGTDVELREAGLSLEGLRLVGGGLNVVEPTARLALAGRYDHAARRLVLGQAKLESGTLAIEAGNVIAAMPGDGPIELSGNVAYGGNLARLQSWITSPGARPTWQAHGQLQGKGQLTQAAEVISGRLDATVTNLLLQSATGKQFQEPEARLIVRGSYERPSRQLKLDEILVATSAVGVRGSGNVDRLGRDTTLDLAGQLGYDWQRLMPLLRPYVGDGLVVAGGGNRPLALGGPLDPASAEATAAVDWSGANVYGFRVGPGELKMRLARGLLQCDPLDLHLSEGRLRARPRVRLAPAPAELTVEPGPIVQNVRINPEMCARGLQYIAPVLAGVATAEGRFSIALDQCRIRLDDPAQSRLAGRLTVHSIEVGPGTLVRELAILLHRAVPAKLQRESVIEFHMADGRVHHKGLELIFPELTVRTRGSVGLDQSLSLVAEMPIPPKWLVGHRLLDDAFRNEKLQVPIRGTLSRPQIDRRKLDEYNRRLIGKAAQNALENELNRQLDRLFKPKR